MAPSSSRTNFVETASLSETLHAMQDQQHSLSVYMDELNRRVDEVDPTVCAFLPEPNRRTRLREEIGELRQRRASGEALPLYGATVGVKDIFHVEGFVTRAGTDLPPQLFAASEGPPVRKLRDAGALIMGKTVTTEFAYFEPGPTRNPVNINHTPGGSSSGSAAAVAAGLCTLALGTQTIGSVIRPAAFCGIVGYKPSLGRIDPEGLVYFSRTIDHVGLFTQDVAGMALAAAVLCADWKSAPAEERLPVLGVPDGPYLAQADEDALRNFEEQVLMLQVAGYDVKRVAALEDIAELNDLHRSLVFAEFAQEHARWFDDFEGLYRPRTLEAIEAGRRVTDGELEAARAHCLVLRDELTAQMDAEEIDLWVCPPAVGEAPIGIEATGDPNMNQPWTHAGLPAVTVPAGIGEAEMPLGLQLIARFGQDEELLSWAEEIATHTGEAPYE